MKRYPRIAAVVAVLAVFLTTNVSAQIVTVPPDLSPGQSYRLAFVTSTTRDAASSAVADYNSFVTSSALTQPLLAGLQTSWNAVASTEFVDARDNTGMNPAVSAGVPVYRLDGARVANDNNYFWNSAFPLSTISFAEIGTRTPITLQSGPNVQRPWVWTGSTVGGTRSPSNYLGSGANFAVAGVAYNDIYAANAWIGLATSSIFDSHALYGISGVLTVPNTNLAGDFDLDGDVDGHDFLLWQRNPSIGNLADWQTHYGTPLVASSRAGSSPTPAATPVPEPAAGLLLALALLARVVGRGK